MDTQIVSGGLSSPVQQGMEHHAYHSLDTSVLEILLSDRSRPKHGKKTPHIIWATDNYSSQGSEYAEDAQITIASITDENENLIRPRVLKSKEEQQSRARDKGEVFTPSWICNSQNNLVDTEWFGEPEIFNKETDKGWITNTSPVVFPTKSGKTWHDYVEDTRLEITCGEAPYLISRYDTITGNTIPVQDRIGLLDRKLRVVSENTKTPDEWYDWTIKAYQSIYAFEWQGDNLLLARENALYAFYDYHQDKFGTSPAEEQIRQIAEIISWNFWQMDGLKGVLPNTCHDEIEEIPSLFGDGEKTATPCPGCETGDIRRHNGVYAKIKDWTTGKTIRYIDLIKK